MKRIIAYLLAVFMLASVVLSCVSCDISSILGELLEDPELDAEDTVKDNYDMDDESDNEADEETTKKSNKTEEKTQPVYTEESIQKPIETYEDTSICYGEETTEWLPPVDWETDSDYWETYPPYETDAPVEPPVDLPVEPALPDYNLDFTGEELDILMQNINAANSNRYFVPNEFISNVISARSADRDNYVQEALNIHICYNLYNNRNEGDSEMQNSILVGLPYDVYATANNADISLLATQGYLMDIAELPYVNLDASYWNTSVMDDLTFDGQYFAGVGDMMMPDIEVMVFNKMIFERYGFSPEELYEKVYNGTWTLEVLYHYSTALHRDLNGDGIADINDQLGIVGTKSLSFIDLVYASDIRLSEKNPDSDYHQLVDLSNSQRATALMDYLKGICTDRSAYFTSQTQLTTQLQSGSAAFVLTKISQLYLCEDADYDFGILPMPKFEMDQAEYTSLYRGGMLCVPYNVENYDMVGAALEYLQAYSTGIFDEYCMHYLRSEVDMEMIKIATDNTVGEFMYVYAYNQAHVMNYINHMYNEVVVGGTNIEAYYDQYSLIVISLLRELQLPKKH